MSTLLLALAASSAHAVGGTFAGPALQDLPASSATQIVVAARGEEATLTLTAQAGEDTEGIAYLWPAPGFVQGTQALVEVDGLQAIEAFTRPRVEALECEELVDTLRYRTPPGCASYEVPLVEPDARGEDAVDSVALEMAFSDEDIQVQVIDATEVDDWLGARKLWLPQTVGDGLDPLLTPGTPVIAVYHQGFLARGEWIPPVRFSVARADLTLPLGAYAAEATTAHDVYVYTLQDDLTVDPSIANLPRDGVLTDCQLPSDADPSEWFEAEVDRFGARPTPPWVSVWTGEAATCAPCTSELLTPLQTADLGVPGAQLEDYRVGRLFMRLTPAQLQVNPVLTFDRAPTAGGLRWIEPRDGVGFLFPTCGEDRALLDVCPQIQTQDTRGCTTSPWVPGAWVVLALLAFRRRRSAAAMLALGFLTLAPTAEAAERGDDGFKENRPVWEVQLSAGIAGTPRVRLQRAAQAAPRLSAPLLGVNGRRVIRHLRDGINLGLTAGIRGFSGPLQIGDGAPIRFTFVEPTVGVDMRHGRVRPSAIAPFFRYGARLAVPVLDPDTSRPQAALTGLLHVGGGIFVGNDDRDRKWWPTVELRGTVLPRTDGFVTQYHPALELPWYTFFPGGANIELLVGIGFQ